MELIDIGKRIKERRKLLNVNQTDICSFADVSQRTLSDIENGKGNPSINNPIFSFSLLATLAIASTNSGSLKKGKFWCIRSCIP